MQHKCNDVALQLSKFGMNTHTLTLSCDTGMGVAGSLLVQPIRLEALLVVYRPFWTQLTFVWCLKFSFCYGYAEQSVLAKACSCS